MICYKDMTFCEDKECKHFGPCKRSLTDEVKQKADDFGLPVAVAMDKMDCFEEKDDT